MVDHRINVNVHVDLFAARHHVLELLRCILGEHLRKILGEEM